MANPVVVEFILKGMPDIARAMKTIEQAAAQSDRARERQATAGSKARTKIEEQEAKAKLRAMIKADNEQKRAWERATREVEKQTRARQKAEEKAEREAVREADKAAQMKIQIARKVDREIAAIEKNRENERKRADRERERDNNRIMRESAREQKKIRDDHDRDQRRETNKKDADAKRSGERFNRAIGGALSGAARTAAGVVTGAAGTLAQLGGGFSIADSVEREGRLERAAVLMSNSAYQGKGERMNAKDIAKQAKAAAIMTGTDATELLEGASGYGAKTGDYAAGLKSMEFFGKVAKVTGASMEDVSKTAGILGVQNKKLGLDPEALQGLILQTVRQGQLGSIEYSDLAGIAGGITRSSTDYKGTQTENQGKLLGLAQIAMRTAGKDPRAAATMLANISSDARKHSGDMEAVLGKDTFDEKTGQIVKSPEEFLAHVMDKTGGNLMKIQEMGFSAPSMRMFQALAPTFNEAEAKQKGSGKQAVLDDIREVSAGSMPMAELEQKLKNILSTSSEQFDAAMRDLRDTVGAQLLPEFVKMIPVLRELMPTLKNLLSGFTSLADWATRNPLGGLAMLLGAAFGKELAGAGIAAALQGGLATGLAGATIAVTAATFSIAAVADAESQQVSKEVNDSNVGFSEAMGIRSGDVISQESLDNLKAKREEMAKTVDDNRRTVNSKSAMEYIGMAGRGAAMALDIIGGGDLGLYDPGDDMSEKYQQERERKLKGNEQALAAYDRAIEMVTKGLVKIGTQMDKTATGGAAGKPPPAAPGAPPARPATASQGIAQRARVE